MEFFESRNIIIGTLEEVGYIDVDSAFTRKKSRVNISLNYSHLINNLDTLHFVAWIFSKHKKSFIMVNHFMKTTLTHDEFREDFQKYVTLVDNISDVEFTESFYVIYCGPLNVSLDKEVFENQSVYYLYVNIESSYEDVLEIANCRRE